MNILKGIRPLDYVLTAVMVALAVLIGLENVNAAADADLAHPLDSHSALMIPVFVLAALPILWRRRNILGCHRRLVRDHRCQRPGVRLGHPLRVRAAAVDRDGVRRGPLRRQPAEPGHRPGRDPRAAGRHPGEGRLDRRPGRPCSRVPAAAIFYGIGLFVQSRATKAPAAPTLAVEHVHA